MPFSLAKRVPQDPLCRIWTRALAAHRGDWGPLDPRQAHTVDCILREYIPTICDSMDVLNSLDGEQQTEGHDQMEQQTRHMDEYLSQIANTIGDAALETLTLQGDFLRDKFAELGRPVNSIALRSPAAPAEIGH